MTIFQTSTDPATATELHYTDFGTVRPIVLIHGLAEWMGTGQAPVKRYNRQLRDLIITGRARPGWIVSHELELAEAPQAYENFDKRLDGWTKVLLHPNG